MITSSCCVTMPCASGITHFEDRGICTGIRTAAYSTIQPHCPWMSESIHTTFGLGTSMRSQPEWARSPDIEQSVSIQRRRPSAVLTPTQIQRRSTFCPTRNKTDPALKGGRATGKAAAHGSTTELSRWITKRTYNILLLEHS